MNEEIIKKCEGIDKEKEDLSIIEKFDKIYSNFMVSNNSPKIPKIINDQELTKINIDQIFLDENNCCNNNNLINIDNNKIQYPELNENNIIECNHNNKTINELDKELINKKILENDNKEINTINTNANIKDSVNNHCNDKNIIERIKNNKKRQKKSEGKKYMIKKNNKKNNNDNDKKKYSNKEKKSIKKYKCINGDIDNNISLNSEKKYDIKNAYERLYNQGFYSKNKSQINILDNISQIKKNCNHTKILNKSKELLGLSKKNKKDIKYFKYNIYKPIKQNIKNMNIKLSFHPEINEKTKRIVENMEESFIRLTKPKTKINIKTPKKKIPKGNFEEIKKRINFLYLDGVEKIKKKRELKSCPPTEISDNEIQINKMNNINSNLNSNNISRNIYSKQIEWKKKVIFDNIEKKKIYDYYNNYECTFRPYIIKRNISKLFKKQLSDTDIIIKKNKNINYYDSKPKKEFNISKERFFIINNDDIKKCNNNKIYLYYQKNRNLANDKRDLYNEKNIKLGLIKRKLYNLEKFFSKQNL